MRMVTLTFGGRSADAAGVRLRAVADLFPVLRGVEALLAVLLGEVGLAVADRRLSWQTSCRTGKPIPPVPVPKPRGWSAKVRVD